MSRTALLYAIIALVGWGSAPLFDKLALGSLSAGAAVVLRTVFASLMLVGYGATAGWLQDITSAKAIPVLLLAVGTLLSPVIGNFAYMKALQGAEASQVTPITASYSLVAVGLAILFLGERLTSPKILGAVLIVVGVMLVSGVGRTG